MQKQPHPVTYHYVHAFRIFCTTSTPDSRVTNDVQKVTCPACRSTLRAEGKLQPLAVAS